jgi:4-amino-4-deoxy-L-arabinose transferase-like glycosyltransferase
VLGLAVATVVMLGVQRATATALDTRLGHPAGVRTGAVVAGALAVVLFVILTRRDRPRARDVPGLVVRVWTDPPGPWVAAPLGALLAVPLLSLYAPVLLGDADSARVVAAVDHVSTHGVGFIVDTQDNLLPYLLLGPAVEVWGLQGAKAVTVLSLLVLAAVISYVTCRVTGSLLGAAAAALALMALPPVADRAGFVPMYPVMLALGYLGAWLAYRAMVEPRHRWRWAFAAGACLALAPEAQGVGQLLLAAPVVLVALAPDLRTWTAACVRIYLSVAVVSLPRLVVNMAEGGASRLTSYRTDYWITEGYIRDIQTHYWGYAGINEPLRIYLQRLPGRFVDTLEPQGWVVPALALLAWAVACRVRGRLVVLGAVGIMVLAVSAKQVPPFPRYYSPLWPGLAILTGVGVAALARRRGRGLPAVGVITVVALAAVAASTLATVTRDHAAQLGVIESKPVRELAEAIDDDRGVIGARSHMLVHVTTRIPTWGGQFLTEDEYATFLTWPSDRAVIDVMQRHDIGWVLIQPDSARLPQHVAATQPRPAGAARRPRGRERRVLPRARGPRLQALPPRRVSRCPALQRADPRRGTRGSRDAAPDGAGATSRRAGAPLSAATPLAGQTTPSWCSTGPSGVRSTS